MRSKRMIETGSRANARLLGGRWLLCAAIGLTACGGEGGLGYARPASSADPDTSRPVSGVTTRTAGPTIGSPDQHVVEVAVPSEPVARVALRLMASADSNVRLEAVEALAGLDSEAAVDMLAMAVFDEDPMVRDSAVDALADIRTDAAALALVPALTAGDPNLREAAVDALADIGNLTAYGLLQQALADESQTVRAAAAEYLAEFERTPAF